MPTLDRLSLFALLPCALMLLSVDEARADVADSYATLCASCHGPLGRGDGPVAAALTPAPADLGSAAFQDARTDEQLLVAIRDGGPAVGRSPLMAPFGSQLDEEQLAQMVVFVRTLRVEEAAPPEEPDPPHEEGAPGAQGASADEGPRPTLAEVTAPPAPATPARRRAGPFSRTRFHLAGFATVHFQYTKETGPNFASVQFAPVFLWRLHDQILFEAEAELGYAGGSFEIGLEYAQVDFILWDYTTIVAGLSLLPIGIFGERIHPGWINRMMDNPYPYQGGHGAGPLPMGGLGVQARGAVPLGARTSLNYAAFLTNGPTVNEEEGVPVLGGSVPDNNWNKFVGGRVGFLPIRFVEFGVSGTTGLYDDDVSKRYSALVGDVMATTTWGLNVQGEFIATWTDALNADEVQARQFWWGQVAWRLLPAPGLLNRFEIVVRYGGAALPESTVASADEAVRTIDPPSIRTLGTRVLFSVGHGAPAEDEHGGADNSGIPDGVSNQIGGGINFYPIPSVGVRLGAHYTFETKHFHLGASVAAGF